MTARAWRLVMLALAGALGVASAPRAQTGGAEAENPARAPAAAPVQGTKFSHALHADPNKMPGFVVTPQTCIECHGTGPGGTMALPAAVGPQHGTALPVCDPERVPVAAAGRVSHQPCLRSGCHARDFLSVSKETQARDPGRYARAAALCIGCHGGTEPPDLAAPAAARNLYCAHPGPEFHVELDHFAHTRRAACRDCHVVDEQTLELDGNRPGHAECARCHDQQPPLMGYCKSCHQEPGPTAYFGAGSGNEATNAAGTRDSEVRSCGSQGHLNLAARQGKRPEEVPCFRHEQPGHRRRAGKPLECGHCHFMIADNRRWGRWSYQSLKDIKRAPIIDNERDLAHERCGDSRACHARDVDDRYGGGQCTLCHSQKTLNQFFR